MSREARSGIQANGVRAPRARTPLYPAPAGPARMRVLIAGPWQLPAWLLEFIDLASDSPWLDLTVLPVHGMPASASPRVPPDLRALLAYERRRRCTDAGFAPVDIADRDNIAIEPAVGGESGPSPLRSRIAALRPDLVLLLGPDDWAASLVDTAKWGVWNFDASLLDAEVAVLALMAPIQRGDVATEVGLELLLADDAPTSLVRSWMSTSLTAVGLQRELGFHKVPALLLRAIRRLALGELPGLARRVARLRLPGSGQSSTVGTGLAAFARTIASRIHARRERNADGDWFVLMRHAARPLDPDSPCLRRAVPILPPAGAFWADPCIVRDADRHLLFVEQWHVADARGVIACLELQPEAKVRALGVVLDLPFHLSFPQVFHSDGEWFMTAESGQARCVSLYRASEFPMQWQRVATLLSGWPCVDPTLHFHDGRWYLFASIAESGLGTCDDLYLFVADRLTGPFEPHPANPIVSDVRSARMAGRLFQHDGRLIRPGQDCARTYGSAIVFSEIIELGPDAYRERPLGRLGTDWAPDLRGCHTYSTVDGIEVLDARGIPGPAQPREVARSPVAGTTPGRQALPLAGWRAAPAISTDNGNVGPREVGLPPRH